MNKEDLVYGIATLWGEARGEDFKGKLGVAHVILNRVEDPRWPRTVKEVVLQRWQFSCWNENDPNKAKVLGVVNALQEGDWDHKGALRECILAFVSALMGHEDITGGANHYWAEYIDAPRWAPPSDEWLKIGVHNFVRL